MRFIALLIIAAWVTAAIAGPPTKAGMAKAPAQAANANSPSTIPPGFVFLRDIDPSILQDIRYASENNFTGKPVPGYDAAECVLARPAAEALARVQAGLKAKGLSLKLYDCYRPLRAVKSFMAWAQAPEDPVLSRRFFPGLKKSQLVPLGYIAEQSSHTRGFAVDITLVKLDGTLQPDKRGVSTACTAKVELRERDNSVDMGTAYDCFDTLSHTADRRIGPAQRKWRQTLLAAMRKERFENFEKEWWHFVFPSSDQTVHDFVILQHSK